MTATSSPPPAATARRLTPTRLALYGALNFGMILAVSPLNAFLPAAYAETTGLSLALIGLAFALSKIWDGVVDPAIGMMADQIRTPWGARKPWVLLGACGSAVALLGLLYPPEQNQFVWLLVWLLAVFTFFSLWHIPFYSWGAELSGDYDDRSRVTGVREFFTLTAGVAIPLLPLLLIGPSAAPMDILRLYAIVGLFLIPTLALVSVLSTPQPEAPSAIRANRASFSNYRDLVVRSKPFQRMLLGLSLTSLVYGCFDAGMVMLFREVLDLADSVLVLILARQVVALALVPVILLLSRRIQKHDMFLIGLVTLSASFVLLGLTPPGALPLAMAAYLISGVMIAILIVVSPALMADVADYGEWKVRRPVMAMHFAILALTTKVASAGGPAIMLPLFAWIGFQPGEAVSETVASHFRTIAVGLPALLAVAALLVFWRFPIDRRRQGLLRRRLDRRPAASPPGA